MTTAACMLFLAGASFYLPLLTQVATGLFVVLLVRDWRTWSRRPSGRLALAVLVGTTLLVALSGQPLAVLDSGSRYTGVIVLILAGSLFRVPLRYIRFACPGTERTTPLHYVTALASAIAPLLNLATIALFGGLLSQQDESASRVSAAVTRGVGAALLISPTFAPTAIVLSEFPQVSWSHTLPIAVPLFLALLLSGFLWNPSTRVRVTEHAGAQLPFYHVPVLIVMMASVMVMLHWLVGLGIVPAVALAAILSVGVWCAWLRPMQNSCVGVLTGELASTWRSMTAEAALFLAAGLLASALAALPAPAAGFGEILGHPLVALLVIVVGMPLVTVLGIHPIVPFVLLVHLVRPQTLGFDDAQMYVLWMVAWVLSMLISPVSALNIIAAASFNVSPIAIGLRENAVYAAGFAGLALVIFGLLIQVP